MPIEYIIWIAIIINNVLSIDMYAVVVIKLKPITLHFFYYYLLHNFLYNTLWRDVVVWLNFFKFDKMYTSIQYNI